ncbi:MAG TPA: bifunctional phosphoribosyl-AMP cyclohydrolase/phosphoribosyl-ATP diphosphatase HisIE [Acidimicrobiia bacterium]|nr:bifunctional phosphoribosyl-AMP cyclohydrolase/phosphoribosyl-ATP diphosphatase HisIE [Acidimicrobiia bacterium]
MIDFSGLAPGSDGLVVSVVQDAATGSVRMVGYMDAEALRLTEETGFVHFWSRSMGRIWKKGETSGNTLRVFAVSVDCDGDALLITADPDGPTCHTGAETCFGATSATTFGATLDRLTRIIATRADADPADSYTARLVSDPDLAARKVLEEAGEVAFARKDLSLGGDPSRVIEEAADLVYHLLALVSGADCDVEDIAAELRSRMH